jgi:hypothetical protein
MYVYVAMEIFWKIIFLHPETDLLSSCHVNSKRKFVFLSDATMLNRKKCFFDEVVKLCAHPNPLNDEKNSRFRS